MLLYEMMAQSGLASCQAVAKRLIREGHVFIKGEKVLDVHAQIEPGTIVACGSRVRKL